MGDAAYEVRKRFFATEDVSTVHYRCRCCGHGEDIKIMVALSTKVFKCPSDYCKVEYVAPRYNLVYRILCCKGGRPAGHPPKWRYIQMHNYLKYHNLGVVLWVNMQMTH